MNDLDDDTLFTFEVIERYGHRVVVDTVYDEPGTIVCILHRNDFKQPIPMQGDQHKRSFRNGVTRTDSNPSGVPEGKIAPAQLRHSLSMVSI